MKIYQKFSTFINLICVLALLICMCHFPVVALEQNAVTVSTDSTLRQGDMGYGYVYIDSMESLAALDVAIHFDSAKLEIQEVHNSVSSVLYDNALHTDSIAFSYIFDGEGTAERTLLFYFTYQVKADAQIGDSWFTVTIGEAYDSALNDVAVNGSQAKVTITEASQQKQCWVGSESQVYTSVGQSFSLTYQFYTSEIASGAAMIQYDPELFAVTDVVAGDMLDGKIVDVNTQMAGAAYISFVGTEYNGNITFVTVNFMTIANVTETAAITMQVSELYDLQLNQIYCDGYTTEVFVTYDDSVKEGSPQMTVSATYDAASGQVTAVIRLDAESHLGAGDFELRFDPAILTVASYEKGFAPSFFPINEQNLASGVLKFSIISLEDIVEEVTVLTVTFDVASGSEAQVTSLELSGSMLSDALTEPITLDFAGTQVEIPAATAYERGDLDLDGDVDAEDLTILARHVAGIERLTDPVALANADVDGDGDIDADDLTMHARYVAGIISDWE